MGRTKQCKKVTFCTYNYDPLSSNYKFPTFSCDCRYEVKLELNIPQLNVRLNAYGILQGEKKLITLLELGIWLILKVKLADNL